VRSNRREVFSVVSVSLVATQRCGKHISAAVNQHATIEAAVFSLGATPILYNEDLTQLELELSSGINSCIRGFRVSGAGSWQNNSEEIARKELGCAMKTS
jgi:hypothetical protein